MTPENAGLEKTADENAEGETIKDLAERHLHDPNHHTTDAEIRNAQVSFTHVEEFLERDVEESEDDINISNDDE